MEENTQPQQVSTPKPQGWTRGQVFVVVVGALVVGALISLIILATIFGAVFGVGSGTFGNASGPGKDHETFTKENWAELDTDPEKFRGANVDLVAGRLLRNPEMDEKYAYLQVFADPKHSEWNTLVRAKRDELPKNLGQGDYVRVKGVVTGKTSGENAFGGTVEGPKVDATSVVDTNEYGYPRDGSGPIGGEDPIPIPKHLQPKTTNIPRGT